MGWLCHGSGVTRRLELLCVRHTGCTLHSLKISWESKCRSLSCRGCASAAQQGLLPPRVWGSLMVMPLAAPTDSFPLQPKICVAQQPWQQLGWLGGDLTGSCAQQPPMEVWFCHCRSGVCWHHSAGLGFLCCCCSCDSPAAQDVLGYDLLRCISNWPTNYFLQSFAGLVSLCMLCSE